MHRLTSKRMLGVAALAGAALWPFPAGAGAGDEPFARLPRSTLITGVQRDFRSLGARGGHPDFEMEPARGYGLYGGIVQDTLDAEGKPVFASTGYKVVTQATDGDGRPVIGPRTYLTPRSWDSGPARSDTPGGAVTSDARFAQWYRDTGGVNTSRVVSVILTRQPGTDRYIFDGELNRGNPPGSGGYTVGGPGPRGRHRNVDFTWECQTTFLYHAGKGQTLSVGGDDDLWVFIDGRLVIDLGGMHPTTGQSIDLDRLNWLQDGAQCSLKVFYAERHRPDSHLRIETNLELRNVALPPTSALAD